MQEQVSTFSWIYQSGCVFEFQKYSSQKNFRNLYQNYNNFLRWLQRLPMSSLRWNTVYFYGSKKWSGVPLLFVSVISQFQKNIEGFCDRVSKVDRQKLKESNKYPSSHFRLFFLKKCYDADVFSFVHVLATIWHLWVNSQPRYFPLSTISVSALEVSSSK